VAVFKDLLQVLDFMSHDILAAWDSRERCNELWQFHVKQIILEKGNESLQGFSAQNVDFSGQQVWRFICSLNASLSRNCAFSLIMHVES
jgi:hypothetical protein